MKLQHISPLKIWSFDLHIRSLNHNKICSEERPVNFYELIRSDYESLVKPLFNFTFQIIVYGRHYVCKRTYMDKHDFIVKICYSVSGLETCSAMRKRNLWRTINRNAKPNLLEKLAIYFVNCSIKIFYDRIIKIAI